MECFVVIFIVVVVVVFDFFLFIFMNVLWNILLMYIFLLLFILEKFVLFLLKVDDIFKFDKWGFNLNVFFILNFGRCILIVCFLRWLMMLLRKCFDSFFFRLFSLFMVIGRRMSMFSLLFWYGMLRVFICILGKW